MDKKTFYLVIFQLVLGFIIIGFFFFTMNTITIADKYVCYYDISEHSGSYKMVCYNGTGMCKYCVDMGIIYVEGINQYVRNDSSNISFNLSRYWNLS